MTWLFGYFLLAGGIQSILALTPDSFTAFRAQADFRTNAAHGLSGLSTHGVVGSDCPQTPALHPRKHYRLNNKLNRLYESERFKRYTYKTLGDAIRIPTVTYDNMGHVGEDDRWEVFDQFHEFLEDRFERLYSELFVTKINEYGLVFHWQGYDDSLPPILFAAHQDVVPVDPVTEDEWVEEPFSGHFDGTWIWGRGSSDDKSSLIAVMTAMEELLEQGFAPKRSIVLAFGFDEEIGGKRGAGQIAQFLEREYGQDGVAILVDEGSGFAEMASSGMIIAALGTAEKGRTDTLIAVTTPGGHSSVPPKHTSIGILSSAIVAIESTQHTPELLRDGTPFAASQCAAEHVPVVPDQIRKLVARAKEDDEALDQLKHCLLGLAPVQVSAILGTTQAVTLIGGGVKVNALPESASAIVNHRIGQHSSVADVREHLTKVLRPFAADFDLTLYAFGIEVTTGSSGNLSISTAYESDVEPSPMTPTDLSGPYGILSGTIKAVLDGSKLHPSNDVVISPSLVLGNTDTQHYWGLTKHIFRYSHFGDRDFYNGFHTINEAIRAEAVIEHIRFLTTLILNMDEATI